MTKEIIKGTRLIALFDGWEKSPYKHLPDRVYRDKGTKDETVISIFQLNYHVDWSALMPICRKFDTIDTKTFTKLQHDIYAAHCDAIDAEVTKYEIFPVFEKLVDAIHWYNSINTQKLK